MKKTKNFFAAITVSMPALLLCLLLFGCGARQGQEQAALYVNDWPVSEEEFALLEHSTDQAVRMKILQQLAQEYHVAEQFSYDEMLAQMETENQSRAERAQSGEAVYGPLEYTPLQYYRILMGENERAIKDLWINGATRDDLLAYYETHLEDFRQIGEITADVQLWLGGRLVNQREVVLNAASYRTLSEENEALVYALEEMQPGEVRSWMDEQGMEWTATCTGRSADTYEEFDEVKGAVSEQWASAKLEDELSARIAESTVKDGNSLE